MRFFKGDRVVVQSNPYNSMVGIYPGDSGVVIKAVPGGSKNLVSVKFDRGPVVRAWTIFDSIGNYTILPEKSRYKNHLPVINFNK